jgi:hypothetical protein
MPSLTMNLVKRVERLPKPSRTSEALQPLFEAISNSVQSTQAKFGNKVHKNGRIVVTVETGRKQQPVRILVEDNGVGLDKKNYEAFVTTDTDNKIAIGGKGVGRLLWLDCFEAVHVESNYKDGATMRHRSFDFRLSADNQIQNYTDEKAAASVKDSSAAIAFAGLRDNGYREKFPGRATYVFQHLMSHFLPIFIGLRSPLIAVHCGDETRHYPEAINAIIHRRQDLDIPKTKDYGDLSLILMECDKVASADLVGSHFIHFIAHDRTVHSQRIDGRLGLKYFGPSADRVFHACLFGDFLNKNVNQERTRFKFEDAVIESIVNDVCMEHIEKFLAEPLKKLRKSQREIVSTIVETYPSVAFGKIEELQEYVPAGELTDDAIFGHLSRQRFRRDQKQAEKIKSALERLRADGINDEALTKALSDASSAIEVDEQKSLAEYVVRRKVVLDFVEVLLEKVRNDTKGTSYQREDLLHTFICPMQIATIGKKEAKDVAPASHDLWIVDERLTFAQYFSSDVPFDELSTSYKSKDRADVLIFDKVHSLRQSDAAPRVLLVEFKKPGRKDYGNDENPQQQVERYIKQLLAGGLTDVKGRPIKINKDTAFYGFIVSDIVGKMDDWTFSWRRTPDGRGRVYQPGDGFNGVIELIGWDAMVSDARERNKAFFDRMGLTGKSYFSST